MRERAMAAANQLPRIVAKDSFVHQEIAQTAYSGKVGRDRHFGESFLPLQIPLVSLDVFHAKSALAILSEPVQKASQGALIRSARFRASMPEAPQEPLLVHPQSAERKSHAREFSGVHAIFYEIRRWIEAQ